MTKVRREALRAGRAGRDAVIAARFHGQPLPENPHRDGSLRHLYWGWGVQQATKHADAIERIG